MSSAFTRSAAIVVLSAVALAQGQRPVPRLTETYRHYCFDFNWVDKLDRDGKPLADYSKLSAAEHVRQLEAMHANSLMVFTMSISGYMFYDSKVGERHPSLKYDYLREIIRLGKQRGIAMELYVPTMWADRLVQKNPSWGIRNPDGSLYNSSYGGYHPDLNSPAADWYVSQIKELIPSYGGDAYFADGISFLRYGQSEYTVKKFRAEMGRPYPKSLAEDPDWRATLRWETAQVERFWRKLRDAIKEQDPRVEVTFNGPGPSVQMPGGNGARTMVPTPAHVNQLTDYVFTEAGSAGEYATWTRGIAYPKPFKVTFLNRHSILDPFDPSEIRARIGRTLAVGGQPYRYDRTSVNGEANLHFMETWGEIFREVQEKEPYIAGAEPVKYAAVVSGEPTMLYRGRSDAGSHANDLIGALRTLDALHVQHDVVADWNLKPELLRQYPVVILPNAGCLTDLQVNALRTYVREGGSLLATAESSLFDGDCTPRQNFGLADVLGVDVDEAVGNAVQTADRRKPIYIHPGQDRTPILQGLPATELILPGDSVWVKTAGAQRAARLIEDAGTPMNAPGRATERAAIATHTFGQGKAVYVSGSVFARSIHHRSAGDKLLAAADGVRWTDTLLQNALAHLAPQSPWRAKAPQSVWIGMNRQAKAGRYVMHLVNWQADMPARNVELTLDPRLFDGYRAVQVWPGRKPLALAAQGSGIRLEVPEAGPHTMIVFEK